MNNQTAILDQVRSAIAQADQGKAIATTAIKSLRATQEGLDKLAQDSLNKYQLL